MWYLRFIRKIKKIDTVPFIGDNDQQIFKFKRLTFQHLNKKTPDQLNATALLFVCKLCNILQKERKTSNTHEIETKWMRLTQVMRIQIVGQSMMKIASINSLHWFCTSTWKLMTSTIEPTYVFKRISKNSRRPSLPFVV